MTNAQEKDRRDEQNNKKDSKTQQKEKRRYIKNRSNEREAKGRRQGREQQ